jgi:GrpB-like predicted nucleotidyltransferase (UPF0157 family)
MTVPIPVTLVSYNAGWPEKAKRFSDGLGILGATLVAVHHIGSTSVVGMLAKPVIDLMPLVSDVEALDAKRDLIESLGYVWHGEYGVEGRRFCTFADEDGYRVAQLHFYAAGSPHARRQLAFRDYLRAFPDVAADYGIEKQRAAALFPDNSTAYANEKGAWIRATEVKALDWFSDKADAA